MQRSAYVATKVGCATAASKTSAIAPRSTSAETEAWSTSWAARRSNFSGVSLLRMPLTALREAAVAAEEGGDDEAGAAAAEAAAGAAARSDDD